MAITQLQQPGLIDLTYGPNILTLTGAVPGSKYGIQIRDFTGATVLGNVRQTPNGAGNAIFDIQNVLQSYIETSPIGVEETRALLTSPNEVFQYRIYIGEEISGTVPTWTLLGTYETIGGKKPFSQRLWNVEDYQSIAIPDETPNGCTIITQTGLPLTDWNTSMLVSEIPSQYAVPSYLASTDTVNVKYIGLQDWETISFLSQFDVNLGAQSPLKGIEAIRIWTYEGDDSAVVDDYAITNILENGGGPNQEWGEAGTPQGDSLVLTVGTGPQNIQDLSYRDNDNGTQVQNFAADNTHYYVTPVAYSPKVCGGLDPEEAGYSVEGTHRTTMYILKEPACNDYDHIRFSWLNSYGYRDYYSFTKKNSKETTRKSDTYLKTNADFNSTEWSVDAGGRGFTTFNQTIKEIHKASTGYMSNTEAEYLQGLYNSPDVRVQQGVGSEWVSCVINTNKYTQKTYRKDRLFQYDITYTLANNLKSQQG